MAQRQKLVHCAREAENFPVPMERQKIARRGEKPFLMVDFAAGLFHGSLNSERSDGDAGNSKGSADKLSWHISKPWRQMVSNSSPHENGHKGT